MAGSLTPTWTCSRSGPASTDAAEGARDAEEKAARGFERYLREGKATFANETVQKVFDAIKQWMTAIYVQLEGSALDIHISPEVRAIFDKLVGAELGAAVETQPEPAAPQPSRPASRPAVPLAVTDVAIANAREDSRCTGTARNNGTTAKLLRDGPDAEYRVEVVRNGTRELLPGFYAKEGNAINAASAALFGAAWDTWWATNKPNPEPAPAAEAEPGLTADSPATDWVREMERLRSVKPRPIEKLYGTKGPTPEQATAGRGHARVGP